MNLSLMRKKKRKVSSILERNSVQKKADNYYRGNSIVAAGFFITFCVQEKI